MNLPHIMVRGRCLACGLRQAPDPAELPPNLPLTAARLLEPPLPKGEDELAHECPALRGLLFKAYLFAFVPACLIVANAWVALFFILTVGLFFAFAATADDARWAGLREVQAEYEGLLSVVPANRRAFYDKHLEEVLSPLFPLRDRAFTALLASAGESPDEIEARIDVIRQKSATVEDRDLVEMYRSQLKDLHGSLDKVRQIELFLEKYQTTKQCIVASIKHLRNRLVVTETRGDASEEMRIVEEMKLIHDVYNRVVENAPDGRPALPSTGSPAASGAPGDGEAPLELGPLGAPSLGELGGPSAGKGTVPDGDGAGRRPAGSRSGGRPGGGRPEGR